MQLSRYIDKNKLTMHVLRGLVRVNTHPNKSIPLELYCYDRKAVYDNIWDDVTTRCRGLIVNTETDEIVSRPFEKFFERDWPGQENTLERQVTLSCEYGPPTISEKINGCLGIFWKYGIHWGIASKGSFSSPHAKWATEWMENHINSYGQLVFPDGYTPVFEIICQEVQPHCIKYAFDGLVLLALIKNDTGEELPHHDMARYAIRNGLNFAMSYPITFAQALEDREGHEGYVATYHIPGKAPLKLKIKHESFKVARKKFYADIELAKINTPVTSEMYETVRKHVGELVKQALVKFTLRREFAAFFNLPENKVYAPACFAMMDTDSPGKHSDAIWKVVANLRSGA
jgi:RNA ligase